MAESEAKQPTDMGRENERKLKYLDFVQVASIYVFVCFSSIYEYAKRNSGPLKPGVQTVDGTVRTVMLPVYEKFQDVPFEFLKFVDRKVDRSLTEAARHVPSLLKQASGRAWTAAQKAPVVARTVVSEIQRDGVVDATKNVYTQCEPRAKELYSKYGAVAEQCAVLAWRTLNRIPVIPQVAETVIPAAARWSEKYNQAVACMAERDYSVATYLPLIPNERIAEIFDGGPTEPTIGNGDGAAVSMVK